MNIIIIILVAVVAVVNIIMLLLIVMMMLLLLLLLLFIRIHHLRNILKYRQVDWPMESNRNMNPESPDVTSQPSNRAPEINHRTNGNVSLYLVKTELPVTNEGLRGKQRLVQQPSVEIGDTNLTGSRWRSRTAQLTPIPKRIRSAETETLCNIYSKCFVFLDEIRYPAGHLDVVATRLPPWRMRNRCRYVRPEFISPLVTTSVRRQL